MFHKETSEEIRRLHEENAVLKATMDEFKNQLVDSLSPRDEYEDDWDEERVPGMDSPFEPSFVTNLVGTDAVNTQRETMSSLSHPAILWKELQLERKRSVMYRRECEGLRMELDAMKEGGIVDKIGHRCMVLGLQVEELTRENVALTKIQKNQERQLMSDDDLSHDWPVVLASLRQDLAVANDRADRAGKNAAEVRKRMRELEGKVKEGERGRKDLEGIIKDMEQDKFSGGEGTETYVDLKREVNRLMNEIEEGKERERKLKQSARSAMVMGERREKVGLKREKEKDDIIKDLRAKLKDAEVDARRNILNMKELQGTLAKLAVGNMRIKEVKGLVPGGGGIADMDLTSIETVLPEEIDVKRTKFMSPTPPTSEVKKQLKWRGGMGKGNSGRKGKLTQTT